jgi:hypothetical protein
MIVYIRSIYTNKRSFEKARHENEIKKQQGVTRAIRATENYRNKQQHEECKNG